MNANLYKIYNAGEFRCETCLKFYCEDVTTLKLHRHYIAKTHQHNLTIRILISVTNSNDRDETLNHKRNNIIFYFTLLSVVVLTEELFDL